MTTHRQGIWIVTPLGEIATDHDHYRYIVPPARNHGTFYTHEDAHYYTPAPVPLQGGRPAVVQRPVPVEFGAYKHYEQLAQRLEGLANELCLDLHYNYRQNRGFQETYREAYQVMEAAKFVHASEHRGDRKAIQQSATSMDNLFHHVQGELANWASDERRAVGRLSLPGKMEELEALIHHMMFDIGVKPEHDQQTGEVAPTPELERAPAP